MLDISKMKRFFTLVTVLTAITFVLLSAPTNSLAEQINSRQDLDSKSNIGSGTILTSNITRNFNDNKDTPSGTNDKPVT